MFLPKAKLGVVARNRPTIHLNIYASDVLWCHTQIDFGGLTHKEQDGASKGSSDQNRGIVLQGSSELKPKSAGKWKHFFIDFNRL